MNKENWFERNFHWFYFLAGIVITQVEVTFIQNFIKLWGEYHTLGSFVVGLGFMFLVKSINFLYTFLKR